METRPSFNRFFSVTAFGIAAAYLVVSALWITVSGRVAVMMARSTGLPLVRIELIKGLGFVLVTTLLLYVVIQISLNRLRYHEYRIRRLNRVYAVLHSINGAILRINDQDKLLDETCRIAVEQGMYAAAGVRLIDKKTNAVELVASAGPAAAIAERMVISLAKEEPANQGPTGVALREGRQGVVNQLGKDPATAVFFDVATQYGIQSVAAFPLIVENEIAGAVTFYSRDVNAFDEDEIDLLEELAADTSLGLKYIGKEQELTYVSFYDVLTGLPNRALALDRIKQAISGYGYRNRRLTAVVLLSVENYRRITDTHGNAATDKVLRDTASCLLAAIREGDTVAKLDTHDFGVVLTEVSGMADISLVVDKLLGALPESVMDQQDELIPYYRAGIAVHPRDGDNAEELIRRAGLALTGARTLNEPFRYFSTDLEDQTTREYTLEKGLRDAINNDGLEVYYQPIVNIRDRKVAGFEALSRWNNDQLGQVTPAEFIPVAENSGLITSLCHWSARHAVAQLKKWSDKAPDGVYVSINISPYQLRRKGVADLVLNMIREAGGESLKHRIVLEITESVLIEDSAAVIPELEVLKAEGIRLYVDDFGTGYSSLSYLRQFPVDAVKIDREFINGITHSDSAMALVRGIIGMARGIGLLVIAEGVETEEQYDILKELGCDLAQGYLFARPMPPGEILLN